MRPNKEQETPDLNMTIGPNYRVRGGELRLESIIAQGFLCLESLFGGTQLEL